jgi:hypothetical protein
VSKEPVTMIVGVIEGTGKDVDEDVIRAIIFDCSNKLKLF